MLCKEIIVNAVQLNECKHIFCHNCIYKNLNDQFNIEILNSKYCNQERKCPKCLINIINKPSSITILNDIIKLLIVDKNELNLYESRIKCNLEIYKEYSDQCCKILPILSVFLSLVNKNNIYKTNIVFTDINNYINGKNWIHPVNLLVSNNLIRVSSQILTLFDNLYGKYFYHKIYDCEVITIYKFYSCVRFYITTINFNDDIIKYDILNDYTSCEELVIEYDLVMFLCLNNKHLNRYSKRREYDNRHKTTKKFINEAFWRYVKEMQLEVNNNLLIPDYRLYLILDMNIEDVKDVKDIHKREYSLEHLVPKDIKYNFNDIQDKLKRYINQKFIICDD